MSLIGESTQFKPYTVISDSYTYGSALSYIADQPFLIRSNSTSNYFNKATESWITHIRKVFELIFGRWRSQETWSEPIITRLKDINLKTSLSEVLDTRRHFSAVNLFDNVYIFGGQNEFDVDTADCFQFNGFQFNLHLTDPTNVQTIDWIRKQKMIQRRYNHRSIVTGKTIFHIGGFVDGNNEGSIERWIYDDLRKV